MKYFIIILILISLGYFFYQRGKIHIDNERAGIMLLKGGYRAWWIRYSNGITWNIKGEKINLWCFPHFEHCDVRNLRRPYKQEER